MDFSKFFSNFDTPESNAILFFLLIAFLFGLLVGYLLRGGAVRRLRRELAQKQTDLAQAQAEIARLQEELNLREADLRKAQFEAEENRTKVTRLADEKTKLYNEVYTLNAKVEELSNNRQGDPAQIAALNATIEELKTQLAAAQSRNQQLENEIAQLRAELSAAPEEATVDYLSQFQSTQNAMRQRLEALEEKLGKVEIENAVLKEELDELKESSIVGTPIVSRSASAPAVEATEEPTPEFGANNAILMDPLLRRQAVHDDLTRIEGISPFLEKKLNEAGVFTYEHISHWDPSDVNRIVQEIGYLPGRIEQEDWIGQAINLHRQQQPAPPVEFASRAIGYPNRSDDLKIIEGIGPKIEGLLKDANIHTWEELAETDSDHLRSILDAAGESYRIHDPTTWPAQARLAANGSWELLQEYQDQLKGGREVE